MNLENSNNVTVDKREIRKAKRVIRRLQEENINLKFLLVISMTIMCMAVFGCGFLGFRMINLTNNSIVQNREINILKETNNKISVDYKIMVEHYDNFVDNIATLTSISEELDQQNKQLKAENIEYFSDLKELTKRDELFDKYDYAIKDKYNNRTDITYDNLRNLEDLMDDSIIHDTDFILSIAMTESGGREKAANPASTAKGYGQFLDGTSKMVYTDLLGKTGWHSGVALDGMTNLEMMVAYTDYLYVSHGKNLRSALTEYTGGIGEDWYNKVESYLRKKGKTLATVAQNAD